MFQGIRLINNFRDMAGSSLPGICSFFYIPVEVHPWPSAAAPLILSDQLSDWLRLSSMGLSRRPDGAAQIKASPEKLARNTIQDVRAVCRLQMGAMPFPARPSKEASHLFSERRSSQARKGRYYDLPSNISADKRKWRMTVTDKL